MNSTIFKHYVYFFNIKITALVLLIGLGFSSCSEDLDDNLTPTIQITFKFTHHWDNEPVTNSSLNILQFTNANGELLSIERLRYIISGIRFTNSANESFLLDSYNLVDLTSNKGLSYTVQTEIPEDTYSVSFTFGLNNEDNSENYVDLNSESFNVPDMMGGGYHYMQFDGKFINTNSEEQGFNYHAIRAVDNAGTDPTSPQDTFFTVNLGTITVLNRTEIEVKMNIAEWFTNPNLWDLNEFNQMLMPNSAAQIMIYENGQSVFSLGEVTQ
ncbi:hypothetical protein SAMN04489796_101681 [Winogradskyella thalassocola]|uniref:Copper-binding protein MbnP-like domain-containing protein n=1 Tax=Winogradskyella thalassocola TaxID=262004 RepID=A0A1G7XDM7_9FLAO|nr:MbnP family protein [Winogradskyella thalassocola]SDG82299.1 hypothetical protein SAMN04489796_101681 [Winogradskyella thalassocola]